MKDEHLHDLSRDEFAEAIRPAAETVDFDRVVEAALSRRGFLRSVLAFGSGAAVFGPASLMGSTSAQARAERGRGPNAGATRSCGEIARAIGQPSAVRAVARANDANSVAVMIPGHRVIGTDGALTGYGGGLWRKERLIALERAYAGQRHRRSRGARGGVNLPQGQSAFVI